MRVLRQVDKMVDELAEAKLGPQGQRAGDGEGFAGVMGRAA